MAISAQRDLVSSLKTETFLNVSIVSKFQSLPPELRQIFNKDALEKLTQNVFNPLSYYLVSIVDPAKAAALSWPLYDTKTERTYRNELSAFIAEYSGKGLISPVMSSYLVNPACYKVTVFMFQLSQLAVQKILKSKMKSDRQKKLYSEMTEKYKSVIQDQGFVETVERENDAMLKKLADYLQKRKKYEKIANLFGDRIRSMEDKLLKLKAQEYIDNLVDSYVDDTLDEATKLSILEIKNVNKPAQFFDAWLEDIDLELDMLESEWEAKMSPIVKSAKETMELTKELIERQTGEADKSLYMVEYNHDTDEICTKDLQDKVNSQQKYILKNIVKHEKLSFPNLVRGYIVAVSYILKNKQIGDGVYQFNEYLQHGNERYSEMVVGMKSLMDRVSNAESRLEPSTVSFNQSTSLKDIPDIPPLPDLSTLSMKRDPQVYFDTFTPLGVPKNRFNLRKTNTGNTASFLKPQNRSLVYQIPRDSFLKNFVSGPFFERQNSNPNACNLSIISQVHARSNETIAECSSGFTKQQIQRLLSTHKKSSSTKKHKFKLDRPQIQVKKGLFNISNTSSENGMVRSHSSPNLLETKEKQFSQRRRKLSIMQEGSPSLLEVSGIMSLEQKRTPLHLNRSPMNNISVPVPGIVITPVKESNLLVSTVIDNGESSIPSLGPKKSIETEVETSNITPKSRIPMPVKKTSSIEKIINRFKRVRANVVAMEDDNIKTIVEEKENLKAVNVDVFTANKILLPDLLSPSCSMFSFKGNEFLEQMNDDNIETEVRKPRESLGTALGVDNTFLDQFDLID